MRNEIFETMERHLGHLKFDKELLFEIRNFRLGWANKTPDYTQWLGGSTIGVYDVKFTLDDEYDLCEILGIDKESVRIDVYNTKGIVKNWEVSSNYLNQVLLFLLHKFWNSNKLGQKDKEDAIKEVYSIIAYKFLTSILVRWFSFKPTLEMATTVTEQLTNKHLIKKLGNWQRLIDYRSQDIIKNKKISKKLFIKYNTDTSIKLLNKLQGTIKGYVKSIFSVLMEVKKSDVISTSSLHVEFDDNSGMADIVNRPDKYINNLKSYIGTKSDFILPDLSYLIIEQIKTADSKGMRESLEFISDNYWDVKEKNKIDDIMTTVVEASLDYLRHKDIVDSFDNDLISIISLLRAYWASSSVKNNEVAKVKKEIGKIVFKVTKKKTSHYISSIVIGICVYLVLRGFVGKNHI